MLRTILAFEYQGRKVYPLIDKASPICELCMFRPMLGTACDNARKAMAKDKCQAVGDQGYYWAEGETAALQYITERLTR